MDITRKHKVDREQSYSAITALTQSIRSPSGPVAYDCVRLAVIRSGSAILFSELGRKPVRLGDVILLGANTLCKYEPEDCMTATTIYADTEYMVDQVFWQHVGLLQDRLEAKDFAATVYSEQSQIIRLGENRAGLLMPWLDELVALSMDGRFLANFYRMQALWFNIAHVIAPFVKTLPVRTPSVQRTSMWPGQPRLRGHGPVRREAKNVADLLRANPEQHWSVSDLAEEVHLSRSQLFRVFVDAYGKTPIAYLTMMRIHRMASFLRTTDIPIALIAQEVGWRDPDFAARQFRRNVGMTPSTYRSTSQARPRVPR